MRLGTLGKPWWGPTARSPAASIGLQVTEAVLPSANNPMIR